jgi:hypothetical protein
MVVMLYPLSQEIPKVPLVERNQVIQTLPSNRPDQPLAVGIGLRGAYRRSQHSQAQRPYLPVQSRRENAVAVVNQETLTMVAGNGFPKLLHRPNCAWVGRDIAVHDPARADLHHHEYV